MADERVAKTVLKYEVDQSSVNRAVSSVDKVEGRLSKLGKTSLSLGKLESLTQSTSRALSGLGLSGPAGAIGGVSDVLQLRNTLTEAAKGAGILEGGIGKMAVAFPLAAVAIGGMALAVDNFNKIVNPSAENLARAVKSLDAYYAAIGAGTKDTIDKQLAQITRQKEIIDAQIKTMTDSLEGAFKGAQAAFGGDLGGRIAFGISGLNEEQRKLYDRLEALKNQSGDLSGQMDGLTRAMNSAAVAANEAREQFQKNADAVIADAQQATDNAALVKTATSEQIEDRLSGIKRERDAIKLWLEQNAERVAGDEELAKTYDEMEKRARKLDAAEKNLINNVGPLVKAREQEKERRDAEDRILETTKKYNADVQAIEQRSLEERARIQDQLNQRIVDITRQAAEAAENALAKLKEQRADLSRDLSRDLAKADRDARAQELDLRIAAQREEVQALRDHERAKRRILEDAQDQEFELIANRDFLGLFNLRRQTTRNLQRADEDFGGASQARREGTAQQIDDLHRQIAAERQERMIAYQQALQDAQVQYQREITQAAQQKQAQLLLARQSAVAELRDAQSKTQSLLTLRRQQAIEEIRMAGMTGQARIDYLNRERQLVLGQARQMVNVAAQVGGGARDVRTRLTARDSGGFLAAGQMARIGVPGEAFNGIPLPGIGAFMPFVPGNVTKTNQVSNTWNIQGNNPEAIGRVVRGQINMALRELVN